MVAESRARVHGLLRLSATEEAWSEADAWTALQAGQPYQGVCDTAARLHVRDLLEHGVQARYVGTGTRGTIATHATVEARVGGRWVVSDPTVGGVLLCDGEPVAAADAADCPSLAWAWDPHRQDIDPKDWPGGWEHLFDRVWVLYFQDVDKWRPVPPTAR